MIRVVIVLLVVCVVKALSVPLFEMSANLGKPLQTNTEEARHIKTGLLDVETRHLAETSQQAYRSRQNSLFQKYLHSTPTDPPDPICNTYSSTHMPYTGFRFVAESKLSLLVRRQRTSALVYCYQGREVTRTSKPLRFGQREILWGSRYCFSPKETLNGVQRGGPTIDGCYVPARTVSAYNAETVYGFSWRRPERVYGGLFRYPRGTTLKLVNEAAVPVSVLLSDEPYMGFTSKISKLSDYVTVPLAYTADYFSQHYPMISDSWAKYIDINEEYKPVVSTTWPFTSSGSFNGFLALKELVKSEILWELLEKTYARMPARPELVADILLGHTNRSTLHSLIGTEAYGPLHFGYLQQRPTDPNFRQLLKSSALDLLGNEARAMLDQIKMRLVFVENKRFARFIYLLISRIVSIT